MSRLKHKDKKLPLILILSFLIPCIVMCIVYIVDKIEPFGSYSGLFWDGVIQYKDYFDYLWDVLHGNANLEYSAAKSLGGQTIGLVAYYLTCPLNLLLYFFDKAHVSLFVSVSMVLKIAFSGLTASYFLRKRFHIGSLPSVLLSCCYALMEYNVVYCRNIQWLDGVVMLPLACLGVYELLYNNKKGLLFFSVFMTIFSNWYSGYMVCLMTGFYFLYELVMKYDFRKLKSIIKPAVADVVKVGADMVLGVLASGVLLIPALLSLMGGKADMDLFTTEMNMGLLEVFKGLDINASFNHSNAPILYCGAIVLVLAVYFLFDGRADKKKRICTGAFALFIILSFCFVELDIMWTAFVRSYSYNYRWAFIFGFISVVLAANAVQSIKKNGFNKKAAMGAFGAVAVIFLLLDYKELYNNRFIAYLYVFAIAVYFVLLFIMFGKNNKKAVKTVCAVLICALTVCELSANSVKAFSDGKRDTQQLTEYIDEMSAVVDGIKAEDQSFFRLEKNVSYLNLINKTAADSESFMFNYNGVENYTSTYDPNVDLFMARMGYSDSTGITEENQSEKIMGPTDVYWNSPLLLMDSLLGIKYQILTEEAPGQSLYKSDLGITGYDDAAVYLNEYALPLAYNVSPELYETLEYSSDPFENQEKFVSAALGRYSNVYIQPEVDSTQMQKDIQRFAVTASINGPMYFYTDSSEYHSSLNKQHCELYVNGEKVQDICRRFKVNAVYIGDFSAGEEISVEIRHIDTDEQEKTHTAYFAQLNMNEFESVYSQLSSGSVSTLNINGNTVSGTYDTDTDSTVMMTLPYTEGWTLYVDGEETEYKVIGDTFIGFDLTAGSHQIEMKYSTLHKNAGIAATVIGFAGFAGWCVIDRLRKRKKGE